MGTAVAVLLMRFSFRGDQLLFALAMLPLVVPVIILAVALLVLFLAVGIDRSLWTVAIAHTVVALPYVILIVSASLAGFDPISKKRPWTSVRHTGELSSILCCRSLPLQSCPLGS